MISIIVALSENNVVGNNGKLPWKLSADLKRLKSLTMGHHIIMGRKTWESLCRLLPGRIHVVITNQKNYLAEGAIVVNSLEEGIKKSAGDDDVFIFGGGEIFKNALSLTDKIFMTVVHAQVDGDAFFPSLNSDDWQEVERERHPADEKNEYDFSFVTLIRKK